MKPACISGQSFKRILCVLLSALLLAACACSGRGGGHSGAKPVPADPAAEGNLALLPSAAVSCSVPTRPGCGTEQLRAPSEGVFCAVAESGEFSLTYSLGTYTQIMRVDLYPSSADGYVGRYFPHSVTVSVSADGKNYTEVSRYRNIDVPESIPVLEFPPVYAAYVRLSFSELEQADGAYMCELAAVEIISAAGEYPYPD